MAEQPEVRIVEVLLRDGLQTMVHESGWHVPTTDEKVDLINRIAAAGVPEIEVTGFVHPRVIPMLADADEVVRRLPQREGVVYRALVPNLKGAQRAIDAGCTKISALIVASETYSRKNSNMSVADNLEQIRLISELAQDRGVTLDVGMGICFLCPYEGPVPASAVLDLINTFVDLGIHEVSIADSIGMSNPRDVGERVAAIVSRFSGLALGVHLHERTGMALANVVAAWEAGATSFESCIGGYGGGIAMPVSVLGMGNVPTEDVVHLFREMGVRTGVDLDALRAVSDHVGELLGVPSRARVAQYGTYEEFRDMAQQYR
jgi:hydroxymethylglutaryl-CoA lyase